MGDANITASRWRMVEVGRVVIFSKPNQHEGKVAVIVEVVDHKRVLVDGPSDDAKKAVPRHSAQLSSLALTPIMMQKLPRGIGHGPLKKKWEEAKIDQQWTDSTFAKSRARSDKRRQLNDFERFKVMRLKKQVRNEEKKALAKVKASA